MGRYYANTKIFHFADRLQALAQGQSAAPVHIRLKPTNRCNHRCSYCCYRNENLFLGQLMDEGDQIPREKMRELVDDFGRLGVRAVTFSGGGEPLCYPHIIETLEGLAARNIKFAMLSNGGLLQGEVAELLAQKAVWLRISMDAANREDYAKSRQVAPAEFDKVCANLAAFARLPERRCVLGLNFIVTRENSKTVADFLALSKELGVDHVKVSGAVVSTTPSENDAYHLPIYGHVREQLDQALKNLVDEDFSIIDLLHEPKSKKEMYVKDYTWCPMSRFLIVIGADQCVYTCQDKAYTQNGLLGSLQDIDFFTFWNSPEAEAARRRVDPSRHCLHHCVAHGKNLMLLDYFDADAEHLDFV